MPKYARDCWKAYETDKDASRLVQCLYKGVIKNRGQHGLNARAIEALVRLAHQAGQQTYIDLKDVSQTKGETGGLYPWLNEYGADILEQKLGVRAFRIRKEFYGAMLSLFPEDPTASTNRSILRLQGLGKEIWAGIDAQDYVDRERASWPG